MINRQKRTIIILVALLLIIIGVVWIIRLKKANPTLPASLQPAPVQGLTPEQKKEILKALTPQKGEKNRAIPTPEQNAQVIQQLAPPGPATSKTGQAPTARKGITPEQKKKILDALAPRK